MTSRILPAVPVALRTRQARWISNKRAARAILEGREPHVPHQVKGCRQRCGACGFVAPPGEKGHNARTCPKAAT